MSLQFRIMLSAKIKIIFTKVNLLKAWKFTSFETLNAHNQISSFTFEKNVLKSSFLRFGVSKATMGSKFEIRLSSELQNLLHK